MNLETENQIVYIQAGSFHHSVLAAAAADYNVTAAASSSSHHAEGHSADGIFPLALPRFISNIKAAIDRPEIDKSARLRWLQMRELNEV